MAGLTRVDSAVQGLETSPTKADFSRVDSGVHDLETSPTQEKLIRVDSAVQGLEPSPTKEKISHRRASSSAAGVQTIKDLKKNQIEIEIAMETQATGWKINTSPSTVEDKDILKKPLVTPLVKAIKLRFDTGIVVTARNNNGVTIKDALDVMYSKNKKRADDEIPEPYLKGFEWLPTHPQLKNDPERKKEREEEWEQLHIHLSPIPTVSSSGGGKKKKNKNAD
ncbi:hypothetical protein F5Y11DRAFT_345420 [Daldinia sp. FL1419]|nr:hypothetical protein F5Y11DRAFT_345420 [Daldinia sp. FL1419]